MLKFLLLHPVFIFLFASFALHSKAIEPNKAVLKVNEKKVSFFEFKNELNRSYLQMLKIDRESIDMENLLSLVRERFIERLLKVEFLENNGISLDFDEKALHEIEKSQNLPRNYIFESSIDVERTSVSTAQLMKEDFLFNTFIRKNFNPEITHSKILDYYYRNLPDYYQDHVVIIEQIVVKTEELAKKLLKSVKRKRSLARYAKKYSISPEGKFGGILGPIELNLLPKEIQARIQTLNEGQQSGVIMTNYGFHIIKLLRVFRRKFIPLDQLIPEIYAQLYVAAFNEEYEWQITLLKNTARIEWLGKGIKMKDWIKQ